uniref:Speckle-type POZ protein (inferred by orthology to a human protein) n=1 Tax=Strongyloides venezuelensis TaxID=75913 RepID=A0A0K0F515_STRVS
MSSMEISSESDEEYTIKKNIARDGFVWIVEKFSPRQIETFTTKKSPFFPSKENDKVQWQLEILKDYDFCSNNEYLSINLVSEYIWSTEVTILCCFYVLGLDGRKKHKQVRGITKLHKGKIIFSCRHFIESNLLCKAVNNELLPNGNLILGCEIFYYRDPTNTVVSSTISNTDKSMDLLSNDMAGMLQSAIFSDCTIEVQDSQIKVHKCVIASRSKVFKSLLTDGECKFGPNVIEINGFRLEVVKEMVNYLYTGKSPNMDEMALELFEIGHKYELEQLKSMAEKNLVYSLSIENVCDYLERTLLYSSEILSEWYLRFVYFNLENIVNKEEWKVIANKYPSLNAKLLSIGNDTD